MSPVLLNPYNFNVEDLSAAILASAPWGFWKCNDNSGPILDSSGSNRSLNVTGSPTFQASGPNGKPAIDWPSGSGYAISSSTHSTSAATHEAMVYLPAAPTANTCIVSCSTFNSGSYDRPLFIMTNRGLNWQTFDGGTRNLQSPASVLATGTWYHVASSIGSLGKRIYVNGIIVASDTRTNSYTGSLPIMIHGGPFSFTNPSRVISCFQAFYTKQLSDADVAAHAAATV